MYRILVPKVKLKVLVTQSCLTLCDPMNCSLPGSSVHGFPQEKMTLEWVVIPFSRGWERKWEKMMKEWNDTGVGCHSLLQGIFPTQGLNLGFLHCRQILYHLSHQGSQPHPAFQAQSLHHWTHSFPEWMNFLNYDRDDFREDLTVIEKGAKKQNS